jgi:putative FmdB family regulatory protein
MHYDYSCNQCGFLWENVQQSIHDKKKKKCPRCSKMTLERLISNGLPPFVKGEVTTIGQLADYNAKKMGKYGVSEKDAIKKESVDQVLKERKEENKRIGKMSETQRQRYIENG